MSISNNLVKLLCLLQGKWSDMVVASFKEQVTHYTNFSLSRDL